MNDNHQEIKELLPLYFEGKLYKAQKQNVENWIEVSKEHKAIYDNMAEIYRASDMLYAMDYTDTDKALKNIGKKIRHTHIHLFIAKMQRIAAVLFIPLFLCSLLLLYKTLNTQAPTRMTITTSPGMTANATLPDGTAVTLNSNSRLSYPSTFTGDRREICLQGEAYFNVTKDARHPFIVNTTKQAAIKVYGTHFDVEAYPKENIVTATLEEGSIAMLYADKYNRIMEHRITPREKIVYSTKTRDVMISKTDVNVATSWKDDRLIFRNTPVRDVLRSLSKRYGVEFDVRNSNIYTNSFTGTLEQQRLDRILEYLAITSNMHFKYISNCNISKQKQIIAIY